MKRLAIIDANALIHRCFHALPPFSAPDGRPIGAVYGTANFLLKMIREMKPDYAAACFDLAQPTFRHQEFSEYKGTRAKTPEDLGPQFQEAKRLFQAFGISIFEQAGFEADDLIASITEKFKDKNEIAIITGDLDTLQLVDLNVKVWTMKKGVNETAIYSEKEVFERFGINPEQVPDFKGLKGDPSDNIPGVSGIGDKTASKLISRFGSMEKLYQYLENEDFRADKELSVKLAEKLKSEKEQAFFSKYLATVKKDLAINSKIEELSFSGINPEKLIPLFKEWGMNSLINRLSENGNQKTEVSDRLVSAPLFKTMQVAKQEKIAAVFSENEKIFLIVKNQKSEIPAENKNDLIKIVNDENIFKIGWDFKNFWKTAGLTGLEMPKLNHDLKLAGWLINSEAKDYSLEAICRRSFKKEISEEKSSTIFPLFEFQKKKMTEWNLLGLFEKIEMPLVSVLTSMETQGIKIDPEHFNKIEKEISAELGQIEEKIKEFVPSGFNPNSPKQISELLFNQLKISPKGVKKTAGGALSTKETELEKMADAHPIVPLLLKHRELAKLKNTYISPIPQLIEADGRIHTVFNQTGTATGRLASENPNMQNLPSQGEWAKKIKMGFVAPKNKCFLSFDYSQIELRVAASLAKDKKMLKAFKENKDIHALTASEINNVAYGSETKEMRRQAKTLNFGVLYGMGSRAFAEAAGIDKKQAQKFIDEYNHDFSDIREWQEKTIIEARNSGFVSTLTGRRRWVFDLASENQKYRAMAERATVNFPVQGLAADIIKIAMVKIQKTIKEKNLEEKIKMILQIHDELIFEIDESMTEKSEQIIKKEMESAFNLEAELKVEMEKGFNLGELK